MNVDGAGAAMRRRERRLRAMLRHERQTVAMELAAALHPSLDGEREVYDVQAQKTASSGEPPGVLTEPEPQLQAVTVGYVTAAAPLLVVPAMLRGDDGVGRGVVRAAGQGSAGSAAVEPAVRGSDGRALSCTLLVSPDEEEEEEEEEASQILFLMPRSHLDAWTFFYESLEPACPSSCVCVLLEEYCAPLGSTVVSCTSVSRGDFWNYSRCPTSRWVSDPEVYSQLPEECGKLLDSLGDDFRKMAVFSAISA